MSGIGTERVKKNHSHLCNKPNETISFLAAQSYWYLLIILITLSLTINFHSQSNFRLIVDVRFLLKYQINHSINSLDSSFKDNLIVKFLIYWSIWSKNKGHLKKQSSVIMKRKRNVYLDWNTRMPKVFDENLHVAFCRLSWPCGEGVR